MTAEELKILAESVLDDMKAQETVCLAVGEVSNFADYMLVTTGTSQRHVRSIAEALVKRSKEVEAAILGVEGQEQGEWVLLDLGDVIVHIMLADTRRLYDLESLWTLSPSEDE